MTSRQGRGRLGAARMEIDRNSQASGNFQVAGKKCENVAPALRVYGEGAISRFIGTRVQRYGAHAAALVSLQMCGTMCGDAGNRARPAVAGVD